MLVLLCPKQNECYLIQPSVVLDVPNRTLTYSENEIFRSGLNIN